mmetsp:Transcript_25751/g.61099  ORF Transcript_25751/g.61099 Transcript_25751/m.61099 type:complete len:221 (-) Transcript_25751:73-735(-)
MRPPPKASSWPKRTARCKACPTTARSSRRSGRKWPRASATSCSSIAAQSRQDSRTPTAMPPTGSWTASSSSQADTGPTSRRGPKGTRSSCVAIWSVCDRWQRCSTRWARGLRRCWSGGKRPKRSPKQRCSVRRLSIDPRKTPTARRWKSGRCCARGATPRWASTCCRWGECRAWRGAGMRRWRRWRGVGGCMSRGSATSMCVSRGRIRRWPRCIWPRRSS